MNNSGSADSDQSLQVGDGEYEVHDGDCLESIAARYGHNWKTIWNHPRNAPVKAARQSPNILLPGDRLHIPPLDAGEHQCATDKRHTFVLHGRPSMLRLRVMEGGKPRANEQYRLRVDDQLFSGTTDGDGNIKVVIPPNAVEGELVVGSAMLERVYPLRLGGMDPVDAVSGIQKRLRNLGYHCPQTGEIDDGTRAAIYMFQKDCGLDPTGALDDEVRQRLEDAHAS